ncbi:ABC transporter permease [Bifidobacterium bombi]|uniref:ABC-2 family transporter protein n=1 Tax=Bifidobacterium bombi DSM 19703 TaxID=1341695 RepID=A0A080N324_9BIFI|nr:ABC transporter permease [Bifidobacterium bombi]KFF31503.1 ABC-2 family transporter protein [Bifidobacterium bombi DSM 19703]
MNKQAITTVASSSASMCNPTTSKRPSVPAALRWEVHKAGNLWYWLATIVFDAIGMFNGWDQYVSYRKEFQSQDVTWGAVWGQAILLPSMVFMPILVAAFAAQVEAGEHAGRNWQRLNASGTAGTAIAGKMLHGLLVSLLTVAVFEVEFVAVGRMVGGFFLSGLSPYLLRAVPMTLSIWAIMTLTQAIAAKAETFASTMSIMLLLTLAGCALSVAAPSLASPYPLALITGASAARDLGSIASVGSLVSTTLLAAVWVLIGASIFRRLARKAI